MKYFLKRGEERYGPYSLAELQQYVQTGNIALTDLAQSEGMTDWAPISQVIGNIQVPVAPVYNPNVYDPTMQGPGAVQMETAPNLHWALLLLFEIITFGLLNLVWSLILANWARKLNGNNTTLILIAIYPAAIFGEVVAETVGGSMAPIATLLRIGAFVAYVVGIFKIKGAMEEYYNAKENMGLRLNGVMTFFFSTIYLQYHVNSINRWKKTGMA